MTDTQKNAVDKYISDVKSRLASVLKLAIFLPSSIPCFWGDDVIARLSDADREELASYQSEARRLREQIGACDETIQNRMNALIDHVERIEAGAETPAEAMPLYLMTYGLFDETLRLSALAMQSIFLSDKIARLLERSSDAETNAAARQSMEERFTGLERRLAGLEQSCTEGFTTAAEKLGTLQETIEDRNRQRWERWATVPDCIKAVKDMVTMERQDGKNIASPGNNGRGSFETLRINVSAHLKKAGKRRRGSDAKPYYQTADIAEAIAFYYKAFTATQYLREFEHIEMPGADILDGEPKREEHAKKIRGISED